MNINEFDEKLLFKYPISLPNDQIKYGTSGFRFPYEKLRGIVFRTTLLMSLRSAILKKSVGIMITASHNPSSDNGIKLIDPDGAMLSEDWESLVEEICQLKSENVKKWLNNFILKNKISYTKGCIIFGYDTRKSCISIINEIKEAITMTTCTLEDKGLLTTPVLHYIVKYQNLNSGKKFGLDDYCQIYTERFIKSCHKSLSNPTRKSIHVDCANGVGSVAMKIIAKLVNGRDDLFKIHLYNCQIDNDENLNLNCGADHVNSKSDFPKIYDGVDIETNQTWLSLDGDADRLIYFYRLPTSGKLILLDGNRMAIIIGSFIKHFIKSENLTLTMGVVQTAYANSRSTQYLVDSLGLESICVPTGVKNLHRAAVKYDFGIYFEPNGHGAIEVSKSAASLLDKLPIDHPLRVFMDLNSSTGCALSNIFLLEFILRYDKDASMIHIPCDLESWTNIYQDYPCVQIKVSVEDKNIFKTVWDETKLIEPKEIQEAIDKEIGNLAKEEKYSRCFVRPSGTENVVRIYSEGNTKEIAEYLGYKIAEKVYELGGKVGPNPRQNKKP